MKKKITIPLNFENIPVRLIGPPGIVTGNEFNKEKITIEDDWHMHNSAQLACLRNGLMGFGFDRESIVVSSGMMIFVPARLPHYERLMSTNVSGWFISIPDEKAKHLGDSSRIYRTTKLLDGLCEKIVQSRISSDIEKTPQQRRLVMTFLDELASAEQTECLTVPFPSTPNLCIVAKSILSDASDKNSINYWARVAGMSRRSFTQHFSNETGLSFAVWRQRAKLQTALKLLSEGKRVNEVSDQLGFSSPSSFIGIFKEQFGRSPMNYLKNENRLIEFQPNQHSRLNGAAPVHNMQVECPSNLRRKK